MAETIESFKCIRIRKNKIIEGVQEHLKNIDLPSKKTPELDGVIIDNEFLTPEEVYFASGYRGARGVLGYINQIREARRIAEKYRRVKALRGFFDQLEGIIKQVHKQGLTDNDGPDKIIHY